MTIGLLQTDPLKKTGLVFIQPNSSGYKVNWATHKDFGPVAFYHPQGARDPFRIHEIPRQGV